MLTGDWSGPRGEWAARGRNAGFDTTVSCREMVSAAFRATDDVTCCDGGVSCDEACPSPGKGATVDIDDCPIGTDRGAARLAAIWTDPDLDASAHAFNDARVLEDQVG